MADLFYKPRSERQDASVKSEISPSSSSEISSSSTTSARIVVVIQKTDRLVLLRIDGKVAGWLHQRRAYILNDVPVGEHTMEGCFHKSVVGGLSPFSEIKFACAAGETVYLLVKEAVGLFARRVAWTIDQEDGELRLSKLNFMEQPCEQKWSDLRISSVHEAEELLPKDQKYQDAKRAVEQHIKEQAQQAISSDSASTIVVFVERSIIMIPLIRVDGKAVGWISPWSCYVLRDVPPGDHIVDGCVKGGFGKLSHFEEIKITCHAGETLNLEAKGRVGLFSYLVAWGVKDQKFGESALLRVTPCVEKWSDLRTRAVDHDYPTIYEGWLRANLSVGSHHVFLHHGEHSTPLGTRATPLVEPGLCGTASLHILMDVVHPRDARDAIFATEVVINDRVPLKALPETYHIIEVPTQDGFVDMRLLKERRLGLGLIGVPKHYIPQLQVRVKPGEAVYVIVERFWQVFHDQEGHTTFCAWPSLHLATREEWDAKSCLGKGFPIHHDFSSVLAYPPPRAMGEQATATAIIYVTTAIICVKEEDVFLHLTCSNLKHMPIGGVYRNHPIRIIVPVGPVALSQHFSETQFGSNMPEQLHSFGCLPASQTIEESCKKKPKPLITTFTASPNQTYYVEVKSGAKSDKKICEVDDSRAKRFIGKAFIQPRNF